MATRKTSSDDLLGPVTLAVGQEDLLLDRAVREVVAAARERAGAGHVGLRALAGLLADNGGSLDVESVPGGGTTLRAEVPC